MIKNLILLILSICSSSVLHVSGQELNIPEFIRQKFENYCSSVPREEVYVHTDRHEYISGDALWFKAYLIDRQSMKPSIKSKLIYIELLDAENKPVIQRKFPLNSGTGEGRILLPDDLNSGDYIIRAYTSWMKNFSPYNCFLSTITIYNSITPGDYITRIKSFKAPEIRKYERYDKPGVALDVNSSEKEILLQIHSDEKFRSNNNGIIYLMIQSHGVINRLTTERISGNETSIVIKKDSLPGGINQITLFDSKGPVCDKFCFIPLTPAVPLILKSTNHFGRRQKVTLEIAAEDSSLFSDSSGLSISVSIDSIEKESENIQDYMILGTEFGYSPLNMLQGRKINELSQIEIDSIMAKVQSNWILWDSIFSHKQLIFRYKTENELHFIPGKLLDNKMKAAVASEFVLISAVQNYPNFQYAETSAGGFFNIGLSINDESKNIIVQPDDTSKRVLLESPFLTQFHENELETDSLIVPKYIAAESVNYQVGKIYGISYSDELKPIAVQNYRRFYGKPDFEIVLNDFIQLDSMQEVFFELVPEVIFRYYNRNYEIFITDQFRNRIEGNPTVMINGIIIKDLHILGGLDPSIVSKIDVIACKYRVGNYVFNGIINVITKNGYLSNIQLPDNVYNLQYRVIDQQFSFHSPDYSSSAELNSSIPDFRSTLYWNHDVRCDHNGDLRINFWSSDILSGYSINIQGIDRKGKCISMHERINIE